MAEFAWNVAPAFRMAKPTVADPAAAGVVARPLESLGLATVMLRKGKGAALAKKVKALYGLKLPDSPRREANGDIAFIATGPDIWIAVNEAGKQGWADRLAADLKDLASVTDQSDGYAPVRLSGPRVLDLLGKGVFVDLHPSAFPVGAAAGVSIAHIGVVMWRRDENAYDLMSFRSYAASFWHWIAHSAAEYGLALEP